MEHAWPACARLRARPAARDGDAGGGSAIGGRRPWRGGVRHITDLRGQPIAAARNGLDVGCAIRPIAQRLAQRVDVLRQIAFLDEGVRPQRFHQLGLRHDAVLLRASSTSRSNVFGGIVIGSPPRSSRLSATSSDTGRIRRPGLRSLRRDPALRERRTQFRSGRVARLRVFLQAARDHLDQIGGSPFEERGRARHHRHQRIDLGIAAERGAAAEHLVEHRAEREDVRARASTGMALRLFGSHVGRRPEHGAVTRQRRQCRAPRMAAASTRFARPKSSTLMASRPDDRVTMMLRGLQIAVHDAGGVRRRQRVGDLHGVFERAERARSGRPAIT